MKKTLLIQSLLLCFVISAQAQFTMAGKIEYERRVNIYAQMAEMDNNEWFEKLKAQIPKFSSSYFDLLFDTAHTLYKPGRQVEQNSLLKMFGGGPAMENTVYTDLRTEKVTAAKKVYEQKFLVQDTMRKMDWVIKDEIRTIADFKCRKAVGRMCDSVYVVAFYTDDIAVNGGPEMFSGLPGMILEIAIPRLHTTWVAEKVDLGVPKDTEFIIPEKGKKVNEQQLGDAVRDGFKDWGKLAPRNIWWTVL